MDSETKASLRLAVEDNPLSPRTLKAVIHLAVCGALRRDVGAHGPDALASASWEILVVERMAGEKMGAPNFGAAMAYSPYVAAESIRIMFAATLEKKARPGDAARILDVARKWLDGDSSGAEGSLKALLGDRVPRGGRHGASYFLALASSAVNLFSDRERRTLVRAAFAAADD